MDFAKLNLNSPQRKALWRQQREPVQALLEQIRLETFDGEASLEEDYVSRFSGLARPNMALGTTTDLAGFLAVCVSPRQASQLRVVVSNGHTAARYDTLPEELAEALARGLRRWLAQPMYRQARTTP